MVAAARWLRANAPRDAARALSVGAPPGPLSYWLEVGLLGQSRDKAAAARRDFTARQPMGRFGTPDEIAALALYLASDEAAFTTGQAHVIDGGWVN